ncbi:kinase-like protein [Melanomma pulvis-pyrius CBS 109.77]|uniref:EKC/KEOPS complex subunit BUD32 n=1 Tax=Melanomma pulvis-pyrius CBS 109.77 TaxID=1314802 RepID=A0A6A6XF38_9PLEO|nr:kinase-like protein [Melanomma pulvis-pyrius CBS 109.77]
MNLPPYNPETDDDGLGPFFFPPEVEYSEDLEDYVQGGFHPVHLGEVYHDGRYKIIHKLGAGGFSTVWLARDAQTNRNVALKIIRADDSEGYQAQLPLAVEEDPGFFVSPLGCFWLDGPNGRHVCHVLPVLGPSMSHLSHLRHRLEPSFARNLAWQATRAVEFLHSRGICHGDITSANIVLRISSKFHELSEEQTCALLGPPKTDPIIRYSRLPPGPSAPEYVVGAVDFSIIDFAWFQESISIIDFDQCFRSSNPPSRMLGTPSKYLAPEAIFERPGPPSDVWALGCAIFRMRGGRDIFEEFGNSAPSGAVFSMVDAIGDLPSYWRNRVFDDDGLPVPNDTATHNDVSIITNYTPLSRPLKSQILSIVDTTAPSKYFWKPPEENTYNGCLELHPHNTALSAISEEEANSFYDLLSRIFVYDPAQRWSAAQLSTHPWFRDASASTRSTQE